MDLATNQGIKVLRAGTSWHGGAHEWSLPTRATDGAWTPGEWTPRVAPSVCSQGWHLTTEPGRWWSGDAGVTAYLAEWDGALARREDDEKFAVERCRLLRELTANELAAFGVFLSGDHEVRPGRAWAYGSAMVRAYGSAMVWAHGSATVTAYGSATVWAYSSAMVRAYGSATVTAYGSATVRAHGSAMVRAYGSAMVRAYGSAMVWAHGSAKAHAAGQSVATACDTGVVVTRADQGVIVDRRGDTPRTVCKRGGLDGWRYADGEWVLSARVAA
jgi:hypothetical protein